MAKVLWHDFSIDTWYTTRQPVMSNSTYFFSLHYFATRKHWVIWLHDNITSFLLCGTNQTPSLNIHIWRGLITKTQYYSYCTHLPIIIKELNINSCFYHSRWSKPQYVKFDDSNPLVSQKCFHQHKWNQHSFYFPNNIWQNKKEIIKKKS